MKRKGFTLIELMMSLAVLAILAALAIKGGTSISRMSTLIMNSVVFFLLLIVIVPGLKEDLSMSLLFSLFLLPFLVNMLALAKRRDRS